MCFLFKLVVYMAVVCRMIFTVSQGPDQVFLSYRRLSQRRCQKGLICNKTYALTHRWQGKNDMSSLIRSVHQLHSLAIDSKNKYFAKS